MKYLLELETVQPVPDTDELTSRVARVVRALGCDVLGVRIAPEGPVCPQDARGDGFPPPMADDLVWYGCVLQCPTPLCGHPQPVPPWFPEPAPPAPESR